MIRFSGLVDLRPLKEDVGSHDDDPTLDVDPTGAESNESNMVKANLMSIQKLSGNLFEMLGENDVIEDWVKDRIAKCEEYISSIHTFMEYELKKNSTSGLGNGEDRPAVNPMHSEENDIGPRGY